MMGRGVEPKPMSREEAPRVQNRADGERRDFSRPG